jgi:branched-subunit amino acid ABC-type transport system permease component
VLKAFIVVVVGGMGNLGGSIAAAIFISLLESITRLDLRQPGPGRDCLNQMPLIRVLWVLIRETSATFPT